MSLSPTVITALAAVVHAAPRTVPVDPDGPQAQQWVIDELAKPEYQAAQPTWFDLLAKAIQDWLASLLVSPTGGPPGLGQLIVLVVVVVGIIVAFLVFGMPRLNRRSAVTGSLFGEDDNRSAAQMRLSAQRAAADEDYTTAIEEMFRSIARGLAERTVLTTMPGTTAHDFAIRAGIAFPGSAASLATAAKDFDSVRYLGRTGTKEQFANLLALESELRAARPVLEPIAT